MRRKAKGMIGAISPAFSNHWNSVRHHPLNARPAADNSGVAHEGKKMRRRSGIFCQSRIVKPCSVGCYFGLPLMATANQNGAVGELFEGQGSPLCPHNRCYKGCSGDVIIRMGARASMGTCSPRRAAIFSPQAPAQFIRTADSKVVLPALTNQVPLLHRRFQAGQVSWKRTPRLTHFLLNACTVRKGLAYSSPWTIMAPAHFGVTAGNSSCNSSLSIIFS